MLAQGAQASAARAGGKVGAGLSAGIGTAVTVGTLISSAGGTGTAVGTLLAGAGITSSTGVLAPVGIGLAAVAGIVALVATLRKGRMTRRQALALAAQMGIPEATEVVGWTRRVLSAPIAKRPKLAVRVIQQLQNQRRSFGGKLLRPASLFRSSKRLRAKLAVVSAVVAIDRAAAAGQAPPPGPPPAPSPLDYLDSDTVLPIVGSVLLLAVIVTVLKRRA